MQIRLRYVWPYEDTGQCATRRVWYCLRVYDIWHIWFVAICSISYSQFDVHNKQCGHVSAEKALEYQLHKVRRTTLENTFETRQQQNEQAFEI